MANLPWPTLNSSTSTTTSTTNPDLVDSLDISDDYIDTNSAVTRTNAIALGPTVCETTLLSRAAATANPEGWASAQGWDKYRALITELYPKLMLKEIVEVMAIEHNFRATEKMYKSRFTQWGLRKNAKRKGEGDQQSGREKRPIDRSGPLLVQHAGYLTPTVLAKTPRAMRLSIRLSPPVMTPPMLAIPERILGVIWDYFRGSFEAGTWLPNGDEFNNCRSIKSIKSASGSLDLLHGQSLLACRLFDRHRFQDAGKLLISATAQIKEILFAEEPMTLNNLFTTIFETHDRGRDEIAFAILRHFSAMAMTVLGHRHPICRISGWLSSMDPSQFGHVLDLCSSSARDHFASILGPMHRTALIARMRCMRANEETKEKLRELLGKCESDLGLLDHQTLHVRLVLSWRYYNINKFTEAEELGQELLVRSQKLHSTKLRTYYHAEGVYIIAMSQHALGERHLGESNLLDAIVIISETDPGQAVCWLCTLEDWLLEQGREDSAAETRERRMKLQETFVSD